MAGLRWKTVEMAKWLVLQWSRILQAGRGGMTWKQESKKDTFHLLAATEKKNILYLKGLMER